MFGLDSIASLAKSVVSGVSDHFKGEQEITKVKLEAKKQLLEMETKAKIATQQAKIDMLKASQDNDFKLDMIAMQSMNKSWKDELILGVFMLPLILAFVPEAQGYIMGGFQLMEFIPEWWIYLTIGMVVSIMGLRGMLREFMNNRNKFKLPLNKVKDRPPTKLINIMSSYRSKYFKIEELVPKELYEKHSEDELWSMLDSGLLKDLDKLKEVFSNGTMTINNWKWGGNRNWSGIRTPKSPDYSEGSMHSFGKAFDIVFSDYKVEKVQNFIKQNREQFLHINGIERKIGDEYPTWLHIDTKDRGHLFFNA